MDDRELLLIVAKVLNTRLEDPRANYGENVRDWAHTDQPLMSAKFPRIQVSKSGPGTQEIISIGEEFWERNVLLVDIWFYTDSDFKHILNNGSTIKNEELCREYQEKICRVLKESQGFLKSEYGITGFRVMSRPDSGYDNGLNKRVIQTTVRFWYFKK